MKIILVRPNYNTHNIVPPLGLGYLAAYLKKHGIEAKIIDALRDRLTKEALLQQILSEEPDAVGISCLTAIYKEVVELSRMIKKNNIRSIVGGIHPTFLPRKTLLDSDADYVVCGEGEKALLELAKNGFINNGVQGVYSKKDFRNAGDAIIKAEPIENLDNICFPDWGQVNPNSYPAAPHAYIAKNFPIAEVVTSRGCPYECTFCASQKFCDRKIRFRSPENVVEEIKYLVDNFGVREIHFADDNLTFRREHIEKICNLIIENGINISWATPNGIRADKIDKELIELMAKSGCYFIAYGIESANPKILENVKKTITITAIEKSIDLANSKGIICSGLFILGLPGETEETMEETIRFAKKAKLSRAVFQILSILPGSELWDNLGGQIEPDWKRKGPRQPEWSPDGLRKKQLMKMQAKAYRSFYLRPHIFFRFFKTLKLGQIRYLPRLLKSYRFFE